jgi:hypothetical protein
VTGAPASSFVFRLFADYATSWGRNDQIFGPEGALALADDAVGAEIHLLDGGHFLLGSHLDTAAAYLRGFLGRNLP